MLFITKQVFALNFLGFSICSKEFHGETQRFDSQDFFSFFFLLLFLNFGCAGASLRLAGLVLPQHVGS